MRSKQERNEGSEVFRAANPPEILLENDRVRVLRVGFRPGDKAAMHSHPDYVTYTTKGGDLKMNSPSGGSEIVSFEEGKAIFFKAESHEVENVGSSEVEAIVVELK